MTEAAGPRPGGDARVAVVGGGLSGIATAHHLRELGIGADLIEREPVLGGRSADHPVGDRRVTFGGKNIGTRYRRFRAFAASYGPSEFERFGINSSQVENGELVGIDSTRRFQAVRALRRTGSARDLARLARLALLVRRKDENRFLGSPLSARLGERSDHVPLTAHFGPRMTQRVLRPLVVRTTGAEPDEAYLGNFPASLGMLLDSYEQLSHGMHELFERFRERGGATTGTSAEALTTAGGEVTGLELTDRAGTRTESYDAVVLATPAAVSARLVRAVDARLADLLERVVYHPAAVAIVRYERPVFTEATRALVFDDGPVSNAGAYGIHDLDLVRYTFSGRDARGLLGEGPERLVERAEAALGRHFPNARADLRRELGWRSWDAA